MTHMVRAETSSEIEELQSLVTVARLQYADGSYVTKAAISGTANAEIRIDVWRVSGGDPRQPVAEPNGGTLDEDDVIYDSLQTDGYADNLGDDVGYNFLHILVGVTVFRKPGRYRVEYSWSNAGGATDYGVARVTHHVTVLGARGG